MKLLMENWEKFLKEDVDSAGRPKPSEMSIDDIRGHQRTMLHKAEKSPRGWGEGDEEYYEELLAAEEQALAFGAKETKEEELSYDNALKKLEIAAKFAVKVHKEQPFGGESPEDAIKDAFANALARAKKCVDGVDTERNCIDEE